MKNLGQATRCTMAIAVVIGLVACSGNDEATEFKETKPQQQVSAAAVPETSTEVGETGSLSPQPDARVAAAETEPTAAADGTSRADGIKNKSQSQHQQHVVKGIVTQWGPMILFAQPGDQIVFKQMMGHDTETIEGMIPDGAAGWKSKLGQEGFAVTVEVPGVYVHKCNPHVSMGMIGAIVVGDTPPVNLQQVADHPENKGMIGRAIRKLKQALAEKDGG
ncbi:MAG: plastocyanin/azurin family copper-binding protein [Gammaproteobacteria bacterium]|nr:plastocyanin/azurin family copper-binding protein [Gammaproteobacteria bacterium]